MAGIEDTVVGYQGVSTDVLTHSAERVTDVLGRSGDDLVVRIYGENLDVLNAKADEVRGLIAGVGGVARANVDRPLEEPTVEVEVDLARAQEAGVKPGDVRRAAAQLLGGITVGNLFEQQKVFDVVVWGAPEIRRSQRDIEQLLIDTPNGDQVRVGDVADVRVVPNPAVIRHESVTPYLDVTADVAGREVGTVAREIDGVLERVDFPLEHHAALLGGFEERQADRTRLIAVAVAGALGIFLLLQAAYVSWRLAVLSFLALPLAVVGGLAAALLTGGRLTLGSVAGLVGVLGFAARAVLMLIRHYRRLERTEGMPFGPELVVRGTRDILAPTVMAGLAAALVLAPIVVVGSVPGFEILHPMAVVVLGGLLTTMLVTLFVVPVLYLRFGSVPDHDDWTDELFAPAPESRPAPVEERRRRPALHPPGQGGPAGDGHPAPRLLRRRGGRRVHHRARARPRGEGRRERPRPGSPWRRGRRSGWPWRRRRSEGRQAAGRAVRGRVRGHRRAPLGVRQPRAPRVRPPRDRRRPGSGRPCLSLERSAGGHQGGDGGGAPAGRDRGRGRALSD